MEVEEQTIRTWWQLSLGVGEEWGDQGWAWAQLEAHERESMTEEEHSEGQAWTGPGCRGRSKEWASTLKKSRC